MTQIQSPYRFMQGGSVPGGHNLLFEPGKDPFMPQMEECNSIPLRHSDVVVDIGAYMGTYAIRCARFPVKQVTAYEPTPASFAVLSLTQLPNMNLINAAIVGDDRDSIDLYLSKGIGVTNSTAKSLRKAGKIKVSAVNYAEAVKGATVVKIDVEGAEYTFPIVQPSLRAIILDFHVLPDWIDKAKAIIADMESAGFHSVIYPKFDSGWQRAGSWIREMPDDGSGYEPMLSGRVCCGCGREIHAESKALCKRCWVAWLPKHRVGFERAAH